MPHLVRIAFPEFPHRHFPQHHVGGFLSDHDNGRVRITGDDPRHDGRVDNSQLLNSAHPTQQISANDFTTNMFDRDVTKFAFKFHNIRTSNVFSRFEIRRIFSHTRRRIRTSGLHDRHHMSMPTGHRNNQLNKCALPNSLKGLKITLDMADRHVSKDGPFRILGNALTYLLSDFFSITFLHFLS